MCACVVCACGVGSVRFSPLWKFMYPTHRQDTEQLPTTSTPHSALIAQRPPPGPTLALTPGHIDLPSISLSVINGSTQYVPFGDWLPQPLPQESSSRTCS